MANKQNNLFRCKYIDLYIASSKGDPIWTAKLPKDLNMITVITSNSSMYIINTEKKLKIGRDERDKAMVLLSNINSSDRYILTDGKKIVDTNEDFSDMIIRW